MKQVFFMSLLFAALSTHANSSTDLEQYRWKKRLIVVRQDPTRFEKQTAEFKKPQELKDRDLLIIQLEPKHDFFEYYEKSHFFLVGKDGGVKAHSAMPMGQRYLFNLIDKMPMRKIEIEEKMTSRGTDG